VKGGEFLRRVRQLARRRGWAFEWRPSRGKGSHGLLIVDGRRTIVPNLKAELKKGLYFGLLRNLAIAEEDLLDE
jgi:predicted RNA binding protein YcfA (HicA-like mRNA interferase family)